MPSRVSHNGRVTTKQSTPLSRETLELCDWLIDQVTLGANADDFEDWAAKIALGKREVGAALIDAGGMPLAAQRKAAQNG